MAGRCGRPEALHPASRLAYLRVAITAALLVLLPSHSLAAAGSGPAPGDSSWPTKDGFYELPATSAEASTYNNARLLALRLLRAASTIPETLATLGRQSAEQLEFSRFQVAADAEADRQCTDISLFVNHNFQKTIFICANTRWHVIHFQGPVDEILAQSFIHEAAHLATNASECEATELELSVMQATIGVQQDGNFQRYLSQCENLRALLIPVRKPRRHGPRRH